MVRTERLVKQQAAGDSQIAVRGAWTQAGGGSLARNLFQLPTNPANTSAVFWADKLLALCEVRLVSAQCGVTGKFQSLKCSELSINLRGSTKPLLNIY